MSDRTSGGISEASHFQQNNCSHFESTSPSLHRHLLWLRHCDGILLVCGAVVVVCCQQQSDSLTLIYKAHKKLITLFSQHFGVQYLFDSSCSRDFSLLEAYAEFKHRFLNQQKSHLPMLASACPGLILHPQFALGHTSYILEMCSPSTTQSITHSQVLR